MLCTVCTQYVCVECEGGESICEIHEYINLCLCITKTFTAQLVNNSHNMSHCHVL